LVEDEGTSAALLVEDDVDAATSCSEVM